MNNKVIKKQAEKIAKLGLTWDEMDKSGFGLFNLYIKEGSFSEKTANLRKKDLSIFKEWLVGRGILNISDICKIDIVDFKEWLMDDSKHNGLIISTRNNALLSVKSFFSWLSLFGAENLGIGVALFYKHNNSNTRKAVKPEYIVELKNLLIKMENGISEAENVRDRFLRARKYTIMLFQFETGCQVHNLNLLTWDNLFFKKIDGGYFPFVSILTKRKKDDGTIIAIDVMISDRLYDALYYLKKYGKEAGLEIPDNNPIFSSSDRIIKDDRMAYKLMLSILIEYNLIEKGIDVPIIRHCGIYNIMQKSGEDTKFMMQYFGIPTCDKKRLDRYKKTYQYVIENEKMLANKENKRKKGDFLNII